MRLVASTDGKTFLEPTILRTPHDYQEAIKLFVETAKNITSNEKIIAAGGGIRGVLDEENSKLIRDFHLTDWVNKPLKKDLEDQLNTKIYLENDAALAALGEATMGIGQGKNIIAYITVSTGLGGARVVNGKIDASAMGFEPGNQIIIQEGDFNKLKTFESYVSGKAIEQIYGKPPSEITDPAIWEKVAEQLSIGLTNIIVLWSPDILILGGTTMQSIPIEKVKHNLSHTLKIFPTLPEIELGTLGDENGLYGALEYLKQQRS